MTTSQSHLPVFAIIPAAGYSRRMGRDKQLIDIDGRPMLLAVLETISASDVAGVMLVTRRVILDGILLPHGLHTALNEVGHSEMIDSIRIGLHAWKDRAALTPAAGLLICPGDQPHLSTSDINACISAFRAAPESIVIATYESRRGHPMIFPAALADFVLSPVCDTGLNSLVHQLPERVQLVPCTSPGVVQDIDTPEEL